MNELDAIRARRAAITPGVWYVELRDASFYEGEQFVNAVVTTGTDDIAGLGAEEQCHADAAFIAAAPADVDTLLAMVERLTARAEEAEALLAGSPADTLAWALDKREQELREARREVERLTGENANAKAALVAAAALLHQSNAEVERLTGELAAAQRASRSRSAA